jgi:hypothetical protein
MCKDEFIDLIIPVGLFILFVIGLMLAAASAYYFLIWVNFNGWELIGMTGLFMMAPPYLVQ